MQRNTDMQERLRHQMRLAFFDTLEKTVREEPDRSVEWLGRLHEELGMRFTAVLPSKARDIADRVDSELFVQQLRAGVYGSEQMGPLIEYTWELLRMACAPDMDVQVTAAYQEVASTLVPGAAFSTVVPVYLRHAHLLLDEIVHRINVLKT